MKRLFGVSAALAGLVAAGAFAALVVAPTASAWDWMHLPAHYNVSSVSYGTCPGSSSVQWITVSINGTALGSTCDAGFQAAVDAYVDSTICTVNPQAGGSACAPTTTTAPATTTDTTSTTTTTSTTPGATTTASTTPTSTTPADPGSTTAVTNTTAAVTTALSPAEQTLSDKIDALAAQIAALTTRVDRLAAASDAAWLAYQQALESGETPAAAAMIARGTALNVIYGLGSFAP